MGSVVAHGYHRMQVAGWDGTERQGAGVGFSVFCKIWLGAVYMLHLELMFFSKVFKSEHTIVRYATGHD